MNGTMDAGDGSFSNNTGQNEGGFAYGLGFSFAILFVLITFSYTSYFCKQRRSRRSPPSAAGSYHATTSDHDFINFCQGLDDDVLVTFPTIVYPEALPQKGSEAGGDFSGCSICLADYKPNDVLRLLPECGHLFHLKCIDTWLRLHPSCPVCRNSPLPTPLAEVVPLSIRS